MVLGRAVPAAGDPCGLSGGTGPGRVGDAGCSRPWASVCSSGPSSGSAGGGRGVPRGHCDRQAGGGLAGPGSPRPRAEAVSLRARSALRGGAPGSNGLAVRAIHGAGHTRHLRPLPAAPSGVIAAKSSWREHAPEPQKAPPQPQRSLFPAGAAARRLLGPLLRPTHALVTHTRAATSTFWVPQLVGGTGRPTRGSQLARPLLRGAEPAAPVSVQPEPVGSPWAGGRPALPAPRALAASLPVAPGWSPVHARPHRRRSSPSSPERGRDVRVASRTSGKPASPALFREGSNSGTLALFLSPVLVRGATVGHLLPPRSPESPGVSLSTPQPTARRRLTGPVDSVLRGRRLGRGGGGGAPRSKPAPQALWDGSPGGRFSVPVTSAHQKQREK